MSATDLERVSRRIAQVESALIVPLGLLARLLRLEARMDALDKRACLAGDLSIERAQREIDKIMRRPDEEVLG